MKMARVLPIALLLIVALLAAACGGGAASPTTAPAEDNSGDTAAGGPAEAVQAFYEALYTGQENIADFVCAASPEIVDTYEQAAEASAAAFADAEINVSGLTYNVTEEDADSATVEVSGEIVYTVAGNDTAVPLPAVPIPVVNEDGAWKVCGATAG
jgi:hypothetical protein